MKDIIDYEGLYAVTEDGRVWGYKRKKFVSAHVDQDGYLRVTLFKNGKAKTHLLHRIVANAFLPNPNNFAQVHHKNGIRSDASVENLQWVSGNKNLAYMYAEQLNKWGVYVDWSQIELIE